MSSELRLRRGTDTQHDSFTGAEAEVTVNTINKSVHVHDGTTTGGFELARADLNNVENEVFAAKAAAAGVSGGGDFISSINGVTKANPAVVSVSSSHGYIDGQQITITGVGGMTQLNGNTYYADVLTTTTFALYSDIALTTTVNSTSYTTYTSGGETAGSVSAGAPISGSYVTINAESGMPNERRLQAGVGLTLTDSGAGGAVSVAANLAATAPSNLGSANAGASNVIARADHVHAMPTATDVGAVPTARTVSAGTGLSGGGALSSNITLSLNANLHMLTDVTIGTLANGDVIMYNEATSVFENSNTFAKSSILLNNANVAINSITKFNFIGTGLSATVNGSDATRIDLNFTGLLDTEGVQDIVGAMVESNTENGISVTYDDTTGKLNFDVDDPIITLSGDVTGTATMTNLGNVTISTTIAANSVALGADTTGNYIATITGANGISVTGSGVESAAITLEINPTEGNFVEAMQDLVGTMVSGNSESGIAVTYNDTLGKLDFAVGNPTVTLSGAITGAGTITNLANVTITTSIAENAVTLGTNTTGNYVANITANATAGYGGIVVSGSGSETAAVTIGINPANSDFIEGVQDIIGGMVESNTESGIAVTYDDNTGKLNFDVADPVITISGVVNGSATMTNLGNVTITVTQANDSVALGTNTTGNYVATVAANATTGYGGIVVSGSGSETAAIVIGINPANADFAEGIQDIVGTMVETNTESGISVTYNDTTGKLNFDVADPVITLSGDVTGSATMTDLANVTITTTIAANSVALGTDTTGNYVATIAANVTTGYGGIVVSGSGSETAAAVIGIDPTNADFIEGIHDAVGGMVIGNTENGIAVTYDDATGKLNFDVADPVITLSGDVTGSATMTNLGNVTITTTIAANSIELGTDTTGNYVATITANALSTYGGIIVSGSGTESAPVVIGIDSTNTDFRNNIRDITASILTAGGVINSGNGIDVTYNDADNSVTINPNDPTITIAGAITGSAQMLNLSNTTITVAQANNSVTLGTHTVGNYVANITAGTGITVTGSGSETAAVTIAVNPSETVFLEAMQDIVGGMVTGNTENGIAVTYDDTNGKLDFDVNDPVITLSGDVTGSATMTNLGNVTITTTIAADSVALGTDTTGNYVATITAGSGITVANAGTENATVTISVNPSEAGLLEALQDVVGGMVDTNTESGIAVTYDDATGKLNFDVADPVITLSGDVTGSATMTNLGNVTITTTIAANSIELGTDTTGNYVATVAANATSGFGGIVVSGSGSETAAVTIGINPANADFIEGVQDIVGGMVDTNTESGIAITYNDTTGKLNFDVADPVITLSGDVTGSATMTDLANVTITTTIAANSVALGADTTGNYVATIAANATAGYGGITVSGSGSETAAVVIGIDPSNADFIENMQDLIGGMVTTNTENGIAVTYNDTTNKLDFDVGDFTITLTGDVTGQGTVTNLANVSFVTTIAANSVALGTDTTGNYVATIAANATAGYGGITVTSGSGEGVATVIGIDPSNADFIENMQDLIGGMVTTNTENGIAVTYNDTTNKLDFDVGDFTITLTGEVTGVGTVTNLANVSFATTIQPNSVELGTDTTGNYVASITANATTGYGGIVVSGSGQETAAVVIGVDTTNADFAEGIQEIVGGMVTGNTENGITVTYIDDTGKLNFQMPNITYTLTGDVTGSITTSNLGNVTITTTIPADSIALGADTTGNYVANITANATTGYGGIVVTNGVGEGLTTVIGIDPANADFIENMQDLISGMVTTNTENGIAVTYNDITNKLDFDVNDFTITLGGDLTGSQTITNLGSITLNATIAANSVALGADTTGNYVANITANATTGYGGIVVTNGVGEGLTTVIGVDTTNADFAEGIQEIVGGMVTGNTENGITVTYIDDTGKLNFQIPNVTYTLSGDVTGSITTSNLANVTITTTIAADSVALGTDTTGAYVANITANTAIGYSGIIVSTNNVETAAVTIGLDTTNADFRNSVRDFVAPMFTTGNGLTVSYTDTATGGTVVINPNDPLITIAGAVTGSETMTNLSNTTITVAQANNSVTLGQHTVGNYVANITASTAIGQSGITVSGSGQETANVVIGLDTTNADFRNSVRDLVAPLFSTGNGISVVYTDTALGGSITLDPNDPVIAIAGAVIGSQTMTDLANTTITVAQANNSVTLGQHTVGAYVANITANASIGYGGITVSTNNVETAAVTIGLDTTNADFRNSVRDLVAPLFSTGNGISVVYTDTALGGSITLDPNDPVIALQGAIIGSQTMTNLGNTTINASIADNAVTLGQHTSGNYVANITANSNIGSAGILITSGVGEGSNTVIGLDSTNADFRNTIRDITRAILPAGPSNGLDYAYDDFTNILTITPNNPTIAITGSVIGSQEMTALGNVSITVAQANNSVTLGTHTVGNYVANVTAGKGIAVVGANVETADITISVDTGEAQFVNDVQDIFGLMLSGNDESGVTVTYNPDTAKVNFDVNDPTITLTGDVSGSMQMVDLGSISITCTVADSSHDHVIANIIGLQAALDSKVGGADLALTGTTTVNNLNPSLNAAYSLGTTNFRFTNVWATTLNGTAVQAQYADLAERYHADAKYPIGTVVKLGGSKEITATTTENDPQVIGVVSENPAYLMNDGAGDPDEWPPIAMTGRVRVKIVGLVTKGQRIVSSNEPGVAMAVNDNELTSVMTVVGRALRSSTDPNIKLVECIIGKF